MRRDQQVETLRVRTLKDGLKPLYDQLKAYTDQTALGIKLEVPQQKEMKAIKDLIDLKTDEINSFYDNLAAKDYSGGKATVSTDGKYIVKKVTTP
jgi:hypothetical protein